MTLNGWMQISACFQVLLLLVRPLGSYMTRVYMSQPHVLLPILAPFERRLLRICGINSDREMEWKTYAASVLMFSSVGMLFIYAVQRLQALLPLNPRQIMPVAPDLAFNTAASYITNWVKWLSAGSVQA